MKKRIIITAIIACTLLFAGCTYVPEDNLLDREDISSWVNPKKRNLPSVKDVDKISIGMEIQEVVDIIGKPQRIVGSGCIIFEFDLFNGQIFRTWWVTDTEKEKEIQESIDSNIYGSHYVVLFKQEITSARWVN